MLSILKIIFLGNLFPLTPNPINIDEKIELRLKKPIYAIQDRAGIYIDVTKKVERDPDLRNIPATVREIYPYGCVSATLSQSRGSEKVSLLYEGDVSVGKNIFLRLEGKSIPLNTKFDTLVIEAICPLKEVKVFWKNYYHL